MKLIIQLPDGNQVPVTEDNIVGLNNSIELLVTKRKMVSAELALLSSKITAVEKEKDSEYEQLEFFHTASQLEIFDKKIMRMPLNSQAIQKELNRLDKEIKSDNAVVKEMPENIVKYSTELDLGGKDTIPENYLFTSNLKELSGAILHKTAFAFRLAYIIAIEKVLNIKLPIILASPSGKEIDQDNVRMMMNILKKDFSDHQIIIASIFTYDFDDLKTVEIKNRLMESQMGSSI